MNIQFLIDKRDNSEIIRDHVAAILTLNVAAQMALAVTEGKDPEAWRLRVYQERSNPWENASGEASPIVNVWLESTAVDLKASDTVERQTYSGVFNIDVYGFGKSKGSGPGHTPGDQSAAEEAQRGVRLVRNIIMSSLYTYLELRGTVGGRMIDAVTIFQPKQESNAQHVVGARISLRVDFLEFSPQYIGQPLEVLSTRVYAADDGQLLVDVEYDTP